MVSDSVSLLEHGCEPRSLSTQHIRKGCVIIHTHDAAHLSRRSDITDANLEVHKWIISLDAEP
jgi:hypothetical protein